MNSRILVPIIAVLVAAAWLLGQMASVEAKPGGMRLEEFGGLACQIDGRVKPLDSVARTSLMLVNGGYTTFVDANGKENPAIVWLLDLLISQEPFYQGKQEKKAPRVIHDRVYRIENDQLRLMLGLEKREGLRYSLAEINASGQYEEAIDRLRVKEPESYDDVDMKLKSLFDHIKLTEELAIQGKLRVLPPTSGAATWTRLNDGLSQGTPESDLFGTMLLSYKFDKPDEFNKALDQYKTLLDSKTPTPARKARFEAFFNAVDPLKWCSMVYLLVIVLCLISWMTFTQPLNGAAFWLGLFVLVIHTLSLSARMYIQGRPPVTNLYSSAVFIGWGSVGLCLFLEYIFRNGISNVGAAAMGAATLFIAHFLAEDNPDTMGTLAPVLDTNIWLATHVVCVTFGYTATFVAGFLGIAFVVTGVFTPYATKDWIKDIGKATYGILCFATLLSFTGTVLGGIWADQSWGRFWGWDPKENGAVLIVIWNVLILHARWAGLVKERGIAVLTIFGNMVTAWSWFGTNQLGVGLHAYGFNNKLATGCAIFWITQMFLIVVGCLPYKFWWSFNVAKYAPRLKPPALKPS